MSDCWTMACQAPLSTGFLRQEDRGGLPLSSPGSFPTQRPNPGLYTAGGLLHCRQILHRLSHQGSLMCSVLSRVQLFATPWTVACQAPLSMGFFRQEYWSGLPFPPPGDLSEPGVKPASLMSPTLAGGFFTTSATWEALFLSTKWPK